MELVFRTWKIEKKKKKDKIYPIPVLKKGLRNIYFPYVGFLKNTFPILHIHLQLRHKRN
jgi:hypothetical protein